MQIYIVVGCKVNDFLGKEKEKQKKITVNYIVFMQFTVKLTFLADDNRLSSRIATNNYSDDVCSRYDSKFLDPCTDLTS